MLHIFNHRHFEMTPPPPPRVFLRQSALRPSSLDNPAPPNSKRYNSTHHDPIFTSQLSKTRFLLQSSGFKRVLERNLDRVMGILFNSLRKNVFVDPDMSVDGVAVGLSGEDSVRLRPVFFRGR